MAGLLHETAEQVKARGIHIEAWDRDPKTGKRIAFRATLDDETFWISARSSIPNDTDLGIMERLAKKAADQQKLILIRIGGESIRRGLVFEPEAFLQHGELETRSGERKQRGERWLNLDPEFGCRLSDYVEGRDQPHVNPKISGQRQVGDYSV